MGIDMGSDFNGDGRDDILWRNVDGRITNWLATPGGGFGDNNAVALQPVPVGWEIAAIGYFSNDPYGDILWRNANGDVTNWLGILDGGFIDNSSVFYRPVPNEWKVVGAGNFGVLWRHDSGAITYWSATDDGGFRDNPHATRSVPNEWDVAGTGDFNGDGRGDILWRHENGSVTTWVGWDTGEFLPNQPIYSVPNEWQVAGTGDFNNDGRDDILWRHANGALTNWLSTKNEMFNDVFAPNDAAAFYHVPIEWRVAGTGDFNNDGRDDILWRHSNGSVTNWLGIENGGFVENDNAFFETVPLDWIVPPIPNLGDGGADIWNY